MAFELILEILQEDDSWDRERLAPTPDSVTKAIDRLVGGAIGTLWLSHGGEELWASGGPELFNVWAQTGPDHFFDLLGDPDARGERWLAVGGQRAEVPARHCIIRDRLLQAFWDFLSSGHIEISDESWERQGSRLPTD